jgi:hypothetical protein
VSIEQDKALAAELFESGQVVSAVYHLPSMLTREYVDDDLLDSLNESDHPLLAFIAGSQMWDAYHVGLTKGVVPIWLVHVEEVDGYTVEGVGDTFYDAVQAARETLAHPSQGGEA